MQIKVRFFTPATPASENGQKESRNALTRKSALNGKASAEETSIPKTKKQQKSFEVEAFSFDFSAFVMGDEVGSIAESYLND